MSYQCTRRARWSCAILFVILTTALTAQRPSLRDREKPSSPATDQSSAAAKFSVESFSPRGPVQPWAVISVTFNEDVITSDALESGKTPESVFSFEPSIDGVILWESLRRARFVPTRPLRNATEYVVRINPLLRSISGAKLADTPEYRFQTPRLVLKSAVQTRYTKDRRVVVRLEFSDKVRVKDLRKYLTLRTGDREIKWTPESDIATARPSIVTDPLTTDSLRVIIEPGLAGADGPLGIRNRVERHVSLNFRLIAVSMEGEWEQGRPRLRVRFSSSISIFGAEDFVTIDPPVKISFSSSGHELLISGDFDPEKRYTVTIDEGFRSYQNKITLEPVTLSAWMPPMTPFLELPNSSGHLGTKSRMKLRIRSAVVNKVTVTARQVFDNNLVYHALFNSSTYGVNTLGRTIAKREYAVPMAPNEAQETEIDLRELLGSDATGIYSLEVVGDTPSEELLPDSSSYWERKRVQDNMRGTALINLSNLGMVSKQGVDEVTVFVGALDTAKPLTGINVSLYSTKNQLLGEDLTDESGIAVISEIAHGNEDIEPAVAVARSADNSEIAVLNMQDSLMGWHQFDSSGRDFLRDGYEAFLTPERGAYRPGETVHISGFVRGRDSAVPAGAFPLQVVLERPDGKTMTPEIKTPTATGLLNFELMIPEYAPTGQYQVVVQMPGSDDAEEDYDNYSDLEEGVLGRTDFFVEDFVPNRVKIEAQAAEKRYGVDDPLVVNVSAEEMFGQPIPHQPVSGSITWSKQPFQPEEWPEFTFGDDERKFPDRQIPIKQQELGDNGRTTVGVALPDARPPAALQAMIQVTVKDGGRGVTRRLTRTVDPVPFYLGIKKTTDTYPRPGEEARFEIVSVDSDGTLALRDEILTGTIYRVKWNSSLVKSGDSYTFNTHRLLQKADSTTVTLAGGRGTFTWTPKSVGNYLVQFGDPSTGASVSDQFYVSSSRWNHQPWSMEKPETAELVLDKDSYVAGETARLLIKAPFPGTVLLTLEQDRVVSSTVLTMTENTLEIPVPLTEDMLPNVYAVASIIRPVQPAKQWLPHRAVGMVNIPITTGSRVLDIALDVPEEVRPGAELTVTAHIHDMMTSAPVSGDVVLWAVDEGILSLTEFETPAPGDFFSAARRLMVETADFFSKLMPDLITSAQTASPTGGGDMEAGPRLSAVNTERVKPVILWQGPARSGADGKLQIHWKVPQFMGRLRVMAMASDGKRFGNNDATVFVRNPVMVKEYLPRFVAPGDQFQAGFTVYNNTDAPMQPQLNVSSGDLLTMEEPTSETLDVIAPRGQATIFRTMIAAAEQVGQAPVRFAAMAGAENFASSVTLPVRPASPLIRESGSITVQAGESAEIKIPGGDFLPDTTTVTLVVGGLPTLDLAGALTYNIEYPYGCTEQVVSKLFPLLYLSDLAQATAPGRFSEEGIRAMIQSGLDRVLMAQTSYGGLSMWIGHREAWPWASVYGAHFIVEAEKAGYQVNPDYKEALLDYLANEVSSNAEGDSRDALTRRAYSIYVLARSGSKVQQHLADLHAAQSRMTEEARALFAAAYLESGMSREGLEILRATPIPVTQVTSATRQTGGILSSPARETAIMLMTWIDVDPDSVETIDLVRRLLQLRKDNQWGNTQDNSFAMMALGRYAKKIADAAPVKGTVRIGGKNRDFSTSKPLTLSKSELAGATVNIQADNGTAYVWYTAAGVPVTPPAEPVANGLGLTRRYLDRDGNILDPTKLTQGQLVIVELLISGKRILQNVVLQDLLPAGLEIENPRLVSTELITAGQRIKGMIVDRVDIRDDRLLVFADLVEPEGDQQIYRYTARAVSPGDFVLPPAMLDVMYDPSVSARTAPSRAHISSRD